MVAYIDGRRAVGRNREAACSVQPGEPGESACRRCGGGQFSPDFVVRPTFTEDFQRVARNDLHPRVTCKLRKRMWARERGRFDLADLIISPINCAVGLVHPRIDRCEQQSTVVGGPESGGCECTQVSHRNHLLLLAVSESLRNAAGDSQPGK